MAYFERTGPSSFRTTEQMTGAWTPDEIHIAPALGLLAHLVEIDRDGRRDDGLSVGRLAFDLLGTVPVGIVDTDVRVLRPGRTIELVEATLRHAGRDAIALRAWLLVPGDTRREAVSALARMPPPDSMERVDLTSVWHGGFIASVEARRIQAQPGRAQAWVRTPVALLDGEPISDLARMVGVLDIANGVTVPASPEDIAFPNIDLAAHFLRIPHGEWVGFDTTVSFGPGGLGVTTSIVHDLDGPVGVVSQSLTVRPRVTVGEAAPEEAAG